MNQSSYQFQSSGVKFTTSYIPKSKSFSKGNKKNILKGLAIAGGVIVLIVILRLNKYVIQELPDMSNINTMIFSEATVIQDRNGKELYKLYEENRENVVISGVSQTMINALIAMEDQRYREHDGFDPMGILRAAVSNVFVPGGRLQGASTIQQQLLKNLLLNKDFKKENTQQKIVRKLKELMLVSKLNKVLKKEIEKVNPSISSAELRKEMKNKVLELYLNFISFGNNAFGIQSASKIYFSKSASELNVVESSILASIPKSPSLYNPYKNREKVMGGISLIDMGGGEIQDLAVVKTQVVPSYSKTLEGIEITKEGFIDTITKLPALTVNGSGTTYTAKYVVGRKDYTLMRMYQDGYITQNELKQAFIQGLTYELRRNKIDMLAPHFVQWVIEELEKTYDKDTLYKGGIVIKTTLDLDIQKAAEQSLTTNTAALQENGANNSSMVYVDSKNGDVLAYVGSINYFDEKIQGQNDMVRRPRQSGSAIKPLIYALGFQVLPITTETPMFDIPFKIGPDQPDNADNKFSGLLPLRLALAHSRNIPATKMVLALGGEQVAKPFLKKLGLSGIKDNIEYGYTVALGAGEITMLELTNAYMHLSSNKPAHMDPILEIRSRDGSLIYQKEVKQQEEVIPAGIGYLLWNILSDPNNRLPGWVSKFNVKGLTIGLKSGTSNAKTDKGNRPRDGWLAAYNGSKVALFRAGNADGTPMNRNAYGGTIHANPMKNFFGSLVTNNQITNDLIKSVDVSSVNISKVTGKLATDTTPAELVVSALRYNRGIALATDGGAQAFEYDASCNGARSESTPMDQLKKGYAILPISFMPNNMDLADITQWFKIGSSMTGGAVGGFSSGNVTYNYPNVFAEAPKDVCAGREVKEDQTISVNVSSPKSDGTVSPKFSLWYSIQAQRGVSSVLVYANGKQIAQFPYNGRSQSESEIKDITSGLTAGKYLLEVVGVDKEGYSNKKAFDINIVVFDKTSPTIPEDQIKIQQEESGKYKVVMLLQDDLSFIEYGKISTDSGTILEFKGSVATFTLPQLIPVKVYAKDAYGNIVDKLVPLNM